MSFFLGIDIGTSGVKSIIVDHDDRVCAEASAALTIQRPHPLWSEQDPQAWWNAVAASLDALAKSHPTALSAVQSIGLSGQMLGVALIDQKGDAIRPALLWNDGRSANECDELERAFADFPGITGSRAMPGFSAPKLRWLSKHEPRALHAARHILLPKDFVRLRLTGDALTDLSDASATLLVDARRGAYDGAILVACGVSPSQLPPIIPSDAIGGTLRDELATRWRMKPGLPVVGGAADNMAGALGAGVVTSGDAFISLGTSGVYFVANHVFVPAYDRGMHTHRHAVGGLFAQHGVVLSATAALSWIADVTGGDVGELVRSIDTAPLPLSETPVFTPYLGGERTPHNDPRLTAAFSGLTFATTRRHLVQGVIEGVAMALGDCHQALTSSGIKIERVALVGGGSRSRFWTTLIASAIGCPVTLSKTAAFGPALGAARLARVAVGGPLIAEAGRELETTVEPAPDLAEALSGKREAFVSHLKLG